MANFEIYRSIIVLSNYDFGLIHRLIQYTFGWFDTHLHKFEGFSGCELYKSHSKKTWIKNWGKKTNLITNSYIEDDLGICSKRKWKIYLIEGGLVNRLMHSTGLVFECLIFVDDEVITKDATGHMSHEDDEEVDSIVEPIGIEGL